MKQPQPAPAGFLMFQLGKGLRSSQRQGFALGSESHLNEITNPLRRVFYAHE